MNWTFRIVLAVLLGVSSASAEQNVNAKDHGALGDGKTDDTLALQKAVDAVAGTDGTLLIPAGVYMIDSRQGLRLKSRMTLKLGNETTLQAIPTVLDHYQIISISGIESVHIVGGVIEGDRENHLGQTGEWGNGIEIRNSKKIVIEHVTVKNCWGDGFYISDSSENLTLTNVIADGNRRQGLSITSATGVVVRESIFRNTSGTSPACGVDLEPNKGQSVAQCQILKCQFHSNAGGGLQVGPSTADIGQAFVTDFVADGNTFQKNGINEPPNFTVQISNCARAVVRNNQLVGNRGIGIGIVNSTDTSVTGNTVRGTRFSGNKSDSGILLSTDQGTLCQGNVVTENEGYGIFLWKSDTEVSENTVSGNFKGQVRGR